MELLLFRRKIVQMAVAKADNKKVVIFGEDTDLLVLLCHHAKQNKKAIYFTSDKHVLLRKRTKYGIYPTHHKISNW